MKNLYSSIRSKSLGRFRILSVSAMFIFCFCLTSFSSTAQEAFITTWKTDNSGTSEDNQITIPTRGTFTYSYDIDWGDGSNNTDVTGDITHTYPSAGTYTVSITGTFPTIFFNNTGDKEKLMTIEQWGDNPWASLEDAFKGCHNMTYSATDTPNLTNVNSLGSTFAFCLNFDGDLSNWDVSEVTYMRQAFQGASSFNGDISTWDVSKVISMRQMFSAASSFNQDISNWNTVKVTDMGSMFNLAYSFNQDISQWNTAIVTNMSFMFTSSDFDQDLSDWDVSKVTDMTNMFNSSGLSTTNYDNIIKGWSALTLQPNVTLGASGINFCNSSAERDVLTNGPNNWTITDAGQECLPFVTTWETSTASEQINIPTNGTGYNYDVDWGDGSVETGFTGDASHTYAEAGIHTVSVSGQFPTIYFANQGDNDKIMTIEQWGTNPWSTLKYSFWGCSNLEINASDAPNLANVTTLTGAFRSAASLNSNLNHWDVSNVLYMNQLFFLATSFNQPLNNWDVGNVLTISAMFGRASQFNQPLNNWEVKKVIDMEGLFNLATSFNQDISSWDISSVEDMARMFDQTDLSTLNYDKILQGWAAQTVQSGVTFDAVGKTYCLGSAARDILTGAPNNWNITDGGENCIVDIPDANFLAALINLGIDTDVSGDISYQEAEVVNNLQLASQGIEDLTGIEAFSGLLTLELGTNSLTSIDISNNTQLTYLSVAVNPMTSLDVSNNPDLVQLRVQFAEISELDVSHLSDLEVLYVWNNDLSELDVSQNTSLRFLRAGENPISVFDVSNNPDLERLETYQQNISFLDLTNNPNITYLTAGGNTFLESIDMRNGENTNIETFLAPNSTNLSCISVDNPAYSKANWENINDPSVFKFTCNPDDIVNIPDVNFKAALLANTEINTTDDGEITYGEAEAFTGTLSAFNRSIEDATGIEAFSNINQISMKLNELTEIDISNNPEVTLVDLSSNQIATLNVSNNTKLIRLDLGSHWLTENIDISSNILLEELLINGGGSTSLSTLDVSNNPSLRSIYAPNNPDLGSIDVSQNPNLTNLTLTNCGIESIDVTSNVELEILTLNDNSLSSLDVSMLTKLQRLVVHNTSEAGNNSLETLDVSNMPELWLLFFQDNPITSIDVSNNPALKRIGVSSTLITELNLDANPILEAVFAENVSSLTSLSVLNGNNSAITTFNTTGSTNLGCIRVYDLAHAEANWTIDPVNEFCCFVEIPDVNFKNALVSDDNIDTDMDDEISCEEAEAFTGRIQVRNASVEDATGIEAFSNLTMLELTGNSIAEIDVSYNIDLTHLDVGNNDLTSIDVSLNSDLVDLRVYRNDLTEIDLSANSGLTRLSIGQNSLTSLDVSHLTSMLQLDFAFNDIETIDVSNMPDLLTLVMTDNPIEEIDLDTNEDLTLLWASQTALSTIDISDKANFIDLFANNNPQLTSMNLANGNNVNFSRIEVNGTENLTCVTVDDPVFSEANWKMVDTNFDVDAHVVFSTNCNNVSTDMLTFSLTEQTGAATIDTENHEIEIEVSFGTALTNLIPTFTISAGAEVNQASGIAQDFSVPFTYSVTAENPTAIQEWVVTVLEENAVPTDITLSPATIAENNAVDALVGTLTSADANAVSSHTYSLVTGTGDEDNASFTVDGDQLLAVEVFDFETKETYSIRLQTNDGRGGLFEKAFTISITDVNEQPFVVTELTDQNADEGFGSTTISLEDIFDDPDGDVLGLSVISSNTDVVSASISGTTLTITEVGNGQSELTITASDAEPLTVDESFTFIVNGLNNEPTVATAISDQNLDEGFGTSAMDVSGTFTDADEDELTITVISNDESIVTVAIDGTSLTITEVGLGSTTVVVTANDGNGGEVSDEFEVTVTEITTSNTVPIIIAALDDQELNEGIGSANFELATVFEDEDGDELTYEVTVADESVATASIEVLSSTNVLLTITEVGVGTTIVTVTVSDGNGGSVSDEFNVTITAEEEVLGFDDKEFEIYPNPTTEFIYLKNLNPTQIEIYDQMGRLVINSGSSQKIDVSELQQGVYSIRLILTESIIQKRFIKR